MYFASYCSMSGSPKARPTSRLSEPTVLRKLDVSAVLAGSPIARVRGPKPTRELFDCQVCLLRCEGSERTGWSG